MGMIYQKPLAYAFPQAAVSDNLDVAMRALWEIARFHGSVARIGMKPGDAALHVEMLARRAIGYVELSEKEI